MKYCSCMLCPLFPVADPGIDKRGAAPIFSKNYTLHSQSFMLQRGPGAYASPEKFEI